MGKWDFCLCEIKGADQLRSNCEAAKLISAFVFATRIAQFLFFKLLACFYDCTGRFVSDLVGNPEDRFSRVAAHVYVDQLRRYYDSQNRVFHRNR